MSLRSDIHEALDAVAPPAPHLPHVVLDALRGGAAPRTFPAPSPGTAAALAGPVVVAVVIAVVVAVTVLGRLVPAITGPAGAPAAGTGPMLAGEPAGPRWTGDPSVARRPHP